MFCILHMRGTPEWHPQSCRQARAAQVGMVLPQYLSRWLTCVCSLNVSDVVMRFGIPAQVQFNLSGSW
jgi:hypothetical protein